MSENSQNDKYKVPQDKILKIRTYDNIEWVTQSGHPVINNLSQMLFNERTGDAVQSLELFNINNSTFQIRCSFPEVDDDIGEFYIGGYDYYTRILSSTQFQSFGPRSHSYVQNYNPGDRYSQEYTGFEVRFKRNGYTYYSETIGDDNINDRAWFGFEGSNPSSNNTNVGISDIIVFSSGAKGESGINGNTIIASNGLPNNELGESNDSYLNTNSNTFYSRKLGLCGSLFFNGINADNPYLSIPNDEDLQLGTGDFTIEWFQYMKDDTAGRIFSINNADIGVSIENYNPGIAQNLYFWYNGTPYQFTVLNFIEQWVHIAFVRNSINVEPIFPSNSLTLYVNGIYQDNLINFDANFNNTVDPLIIGNQANNQGVANFKGHITNFRWTKGKALYLGDFNVAKVPLTAYPETKLLLTASSFENAIVDSSGNNKTVTNNNNVVFWDALTPFKSTGTWDDNKLILYDKSFTLYLQPSAWALLCNFADNGLKSVMIYVNCSRTANSNQPVEMSHILVNNGINGPVTNILGPLPSGVTLITVFNNEESSVYISSSTTLYDNTSVRITQIE